MPIYMYKNSRRIGRHNTSASRFRQVTGQLWWRHNAKSEKTVHGRNAVMGDPWLLASGSKENKIKKLRPRQWNMRAQCA